MLTYGYIREATMAHLDIDEEEAQAMNLLARFYTFANEAMQAICGSKPRYRYLDITVVEKFAPLVLDDDGAFLRPATKEELQDDTTVYADEELTKDYYHKLNTYLVGELVPMDDRFIAFADKKPLKIVTKKPSVAEMLEAEAFGYEVKQETPRTVEATKNDFTYMGKNQLKFYETGEYLIPVKEFWFIFKSNMDDHDEIDMPVDILLTIPLYIASICLQIDDMQRAQIKRTEFELALARCTNTDFMELNSIKQSW